jgi:hypothetical protein
MLCPTGAMHSIFAIVPKWMMFPSYRTFLNLLVFIVGPTISLVFITAAKVVLFIEKLIFGSPVKTAVRSSRAAKKNQ